MTAGIWSHQTEGQGTGTADVSKCARALAHEIGLGSSGMRRKFSAYLHEQGKGSATRTASMRGFRKRRRLEVDGGIQETHVGDTWDHFEDSLNKLTDDRNTDNRSTPIYVTFDARLPPPAWQSHRKDSSLQSGGGNHPRLYSNTTKGGQLRCDQLHALFISSRCGTLLMNT